MGFEMWVRREEEGGGEGEEVAVSEGERESFGGDSDALRRPPSLLGPTGRRERGRDLGPTGRRERERTRSGSDGV